MVYNCLILSYIYYPPSVSASHERFWGYQEIRLWRGTYRWMFNWWLNGWKSHMFCFTDVFIGCKIYLSVTQICLLNVQMFKYIYHMHIFSDEWDTQMLISAAYVNIRCLCSYQLPIFISADLIWCWQVACSVARRRRCWVSCGGLQELRSGTLRWGLHEWMRKICWVTIVSLSLNYHKIFLFTCAHVGIIFDILVVCCRM